MSVACLDQQIDELNTGLAIVNMSEFSFSFNT